MLGFFPNIIINHDWSKLVKQAKLVAEHFVHTDKFKDKMSYSYGPSLVAELPGGGWISKQADSKDFFVMGGHPELNYIGEQFTQRFPFLTFTPPTIGYSTSDVPRHRDYEGNGYTSLIYPINSVSSHGYVYGDNETFEYGFDKPVMINIFQDHEVKNTEERIWFSLHFNQTADVVKQEFDKVGQVIIQ